MNEKKSGKAKNPEIVLRNGKAVAVILDIEEYQEETSEIQKTGGLPGGV